MISTSQKFHAVMFRTIHVYVRTCTGIPMGDLEILNIFAYSLKVTGTATYNYKPVCKLSTLKSDDCIGHGTHMRAWSLTGQPLLLSHGRALIRLAPNMLEILPIILSRISQKCYRLFCLFSYLTYYSRIIHSCIIP